MHRENFLKKAGIFFLTACMLISSPAMVSADSLKDAKQEKENLENALNEAKELVRFKVGYQVKSNTVRCETDKDIDRYHEFGSTVRNKKYRDLRHKRSFGTGKRRRTYTV